MKRKSEAQRKRRAEYKQKAVQMMGSFCHGCGLAWHPVTLDFHHKEPELKHRTGEPFTRARSWPEIEAELNGGTVELLCANCHRMREHGRRK